VTAPVVEELAKCFALLVLFRELKDEFDGVVDGVVYAAMVGLGFAMIENVQYYGAAISEGVESSVVTFVLRGVVSPFAHPLFTAMFGIGLGYVRERHGHPRSWARRRWGWARRSGCTRCGT
jgi:protease PrsW